MPQPQKLPDPTGWRYVLVHRFARHGSPILVSGYSETRRSFLSLHHGEVKPTVVIWDRNTLQRTMRLGGWEDITDEVGPHTKLWDEEREAWKLDPEGLLPWEHRPGERAAPLPVEEPGAGEEIPLDPPAGAQPSEPPQAPEEPPPPPPAPEPTPAPKAAPKDQKKAQAGGGGKKPSTRPRT